MAWSGMCRSSIRHSVANPATRCTSLRARAVACGDVLLSKEFMTEAKDNPLLSERSPIPFDVIKAADVEPATELLLQRMNSRRADPRQPGAPRPYDKIRRAP